VNTTMIIQRSRWDDGKKLKVFENFDYSPINITWNSAGNVYRLAFEASICPALAAYLDSQITLEQTKVQNSAGYIAPSLYRVLITNNGKHVVAENMLVLRRATDYGTFYEMETILGNAYETSANTEMLLFMTEQEEIAIYG